MAIQLDLQTTNIGVPYAAVYFRLLSAQARYTYSPDVRREVELSLAGYALAPSAEGVAPIAYRHYVAPLADIEAQAGADFIEKCYLWVMAQPDMEGAIRV